ncbi:MAG: bifunctional 23S rRNA (guanine(2069)-N(7))-methyltransferase RlmK/23S rRNA (guanine(2445)-N(2))-methyltransferase RlmL [Planctomycetaceae bacterium]|nr:bifunctional 23S rRNA (guanine(2069)-N(7))-methyltransferase RlmK/23S rRNA (guanine(2445)-N(2))-methyltransferase RlmL [Planctomycetaceae bacterium]MBP62843.1 bifunctional 23S rRNA (guanine(2069)-N(7))-methyltransferase RlmK/23S rRNA (guanine(2445)-N(2))-methyltransferase RlmL [Planctomycetaceae bacterium]
MAEVELIATSAFGLEAIVKREIGQLGYEGKTLQPGRILLCAESSAVARTNLFLRCAERVLLCLGRFEALDFGQLFDQTFALPWEEWIPADGNFPVTGKSVKSQLSSVPACQRMVKKAIVEKLKSAHRITEVPETGALYKVEVALLDNQVTLSLDTTGNGLHKRGYRPVSGPAPLRETLAAALVLLSYWKPERPLWDPFCGTGTIPIEAALIGRKIAPGLKRSFLAENWSVLGSESWRAAREEAKDLIQSEFPERILGTDTNWRDLKLARRHAELAGVTDDIHFQQRNFSELSSQRKYGCVICNPPYGHRMSDPQEVFELYKSFPLILRRLPTWSHYVLTSHPEFEQVLGQQANRRRKLYNGRIACQYYQYHGPRPPGHQATNQRQPQQNTLPADTAGEKKSLTKDLRAAPLVPAFGGLDEAAWRQAEEFRNRLTKRARHLRRWPSRGITCYRLYERDVPEVPLVIDRYEDRLHLAEFSRPHDRTPAQHADWLDLMIKTAAEVLETPREHVFVKRRDRQRGKSQYERPAPGSHPLIVQENNLHFEVELAGFLDTGLFLDHRLTRAMVREIAAGTRFLNLFGYTGSFSVYAAAGGAASLTTVDTSKTYLSWASRNLKLNQLSHQPHQLIRADSMEFLRQLPADVKFDLAVVDPPTYSNSKSRTEDWNTQRDYVELLNLLRNHLAPEAIVFFSTNFRRFQFDPSQLKDYQALEISKQTVPPDFRNRRIHRCWQLSTG